MPIKDERPENYRTLKPIIDRLSKLDKSEDFICVAAFIISALDGAGDYDGLRQIGGLLKEPIERWLRENHPEESKILLVQ